VFPQSLRLAIIRAIARNFSPLYPLEEFLAVNGQEKIFDCVRSLGRPLDWAQEVRLARELICIDPRLLFFTCVDLAELDGPVDGLDPDKGKKALADLRHQMELARIGKNVNLGWGDYYEAKTELEAVREQAEEVFLDTITNVAPVVLDDLQGTLYPLFAALQSSLGRGRDDFSLEIEVELLRHHRAHSDYRPLEEPLSDWARNHGLATWERITHHALNVLYMEWSSREFPPSPAAVRAMAAFEARLLARNDGGANPESKKGLEKGKAPFRSWWTSGLMRSVAVTEDQKEFRMAEGWDPTEETWSWFEARLLAHTEAYRTRLVEQVERDGYRRLRVSRTPEHFEVLVRRLVLREKWKDIAIRFRRSVDSARDSMRRTADIVGIELPDRRIRRTIDPQLP
jgi:hypothetical protein